MWAAHLSVPAIQLPAPRFRCFNYARLVHQLLESSTFIHVCVTMTIPFIVVISVQVWVTVPLTYEDDESGASIAAKLDHAAIGDAPAFDPYDAAEVESHEASGAVADAAPVHLARRSRSDPWEVRRE